MKFLKIKSAMNLIDITKYWTESANDALETAETLLRNKKYVHAMFFLHLAVEKKLKGYYVYQNKEEAPYGHNLVVLALKITDAQFPEKLLQTLTEISRFNIAARYDDYKKNFDKICDADFAASYFNKAKEIFEWLESRMK